MQKIRDFLYSFNFYVLKSLHEMKCCTKMVDLSSEPISVQYVIYYN
jgi:hypothetical protein